MGGESREHFFHEREIMSHLIFDVESVAIANAADYLEPATAPSNYVKPEAIASYIEKANQEQLQKAALDVDLARIVAIGVSDGTISSNYAGPVVAICRTEAEEATALTSFWRKVAAPVNISDRPTLIGFNCIGFDLPLMLRRSLYLGVKAPRVQIGKYRHDGVEDLMLSLSFDGALRYRGLDFWCKRLALDVPADPHTGGNIAGLVADGNWDGVAAHCKIDVLKTVALARRIGVIS